MAYVALKPCCFAGQRFKIGESVPEDLVHPGAVNNLISMKLIAEQDGENKPATVVTPVAAPIIVNIRAEEGDMPLELTAEGLQSVFDVITGKPADAEAVINKMTDGDALILLHISDNRKAIKAAAEARAKALNEPAQEGTESEGEQ